MNLLELWKLWWKDHGTKILGFGTALVGMLEFVDMRTINLVGGALGPVWGPIVSSLIQMTAGLMTAKRGFDNSQRK